MVVLYLSPSIYNSEDPLFTKNKTGFGKMVWDIIDNISSLDETYLLTHVIRKKGSMKNTTVLSHTWEDIAKSFSLKYFFKGIYYSLRFKQKLKDRLRYVYYYVNAGYVRKTIKKLKPDIVHIHGIGYMNKPYIDVCTELRVPYLVTLHGLNGLDASVTAAQHEKDLEKKFLKQSEIENINVSVISSGIKKRILENYGLEKGHNISVITNGTSVCKNINNNVNIRAKYNISEESKIAICVGNITINKNQTQIVKAYEYLKNDYPGKLTVLFLGNLGESVNLQQMINDEGLDKEIMCCGFISKQHISAYYEAADCNIVASINEGFGLSIIEAFVYGVPSITFSDLDAVTDVYSRSTMVLATDRSTRALANAIISVLDRNFHKTYIENYAKKFSLSKMAEEYNNLYLRIIKNR
jgi:glycosyltransferase involved in cell wall biosynthesis